MKRKLVALMDDQVSALKVNKVSAERLHSHMTDTENKEIWDSFCNGNIKILYMSPEALMSQSKLEVIKTLDIGLFVSMRRIVFLNGDQALEKTTKHYLSSKKYFLMQTYQLLQQPQIKLHAKILWKS